MAVEWDYDGVADAYDRRPAYAESLVETCVRLAGARRGDRVCDVGAGTGILTEQLLRRGLHVVAVEPSAAMRDAGRRRTAGSRARWIVGRGEALPLRDASVRLVAFGSSFNVVDRAAALRETARVLEPGGWFLCLWNHRRRDEPLQRRIEAVIRAHVPRYEGGIREEDQRPLLEASGLFEDVRSLTADVVHTVRAGDWVRAWRSHLTLRRQAGERFPAVVEAIAHEMPRDATALIRVSYVTRAWIARRRGD